jgi:phosphate transport system substrate-binding protein
MTPLLLEIGKRFEAEHPDVRVDVQSGGSSRGASDTKKGLADIGMVGRDLKPEETSLHATAIARDGVCFIVNKANPVTMLTDDQIVRMYVRSASNWKQFGGPDLPITLVHLADGKALLELFLDHFKLKSTQIRADAIVKDSDQTIQTVSSRPGAIGYVSCSRAEAVGSNEPIRSLNFDGVAPTQAHVRDGTYPLSRPLNLVTRDTPQGLTKEFLDFARSNTVADLIEKYHFVALEK